jgi:hypothetical protein
MTSLAVSNRRRDRPSRRRCCHPSSLIYLQVVLLSLAVALVASFVSTGVRTADASNANAATIAAKTTFSTSPAMMSTATSTALHNIRGGGLLTLMLGIGKKSAADIYRETLEEQVLLLDRQLRQARH